MCGILYVCNILYLCLVSKSYTDSFATPQTVACQPPPSMGFSRQEYWSAEKAMATHSNTLAWQIPQMEEPGRLQSMGSHRVGHEWSDLAAAAILEWVAIFFSRGSSWSRDQTHVSWITGHISCIAGNVFVAEPPEKPMSYIHYALWIICLYLPLSYVLFLSHQGSPKYCICAAKCYQFYLIKLIMILRS